MNYEYVVTQHGDSVDLIAYRRFGATAGYTESILRANPGLAKLGAILPPGLRIAIPVPVAADRTDGTNIWS